MPPSIHRPTTLVLGTAPPTRCGLASYTANVAAALERAGVDARILRVMDHGESTLGQPAAVYAQWRRDRRRDAFEVGVHASAFDTLLLQHEFGIFPGDDGVDVVDALDSVEVPIVSVLHTVVPEPSLRQRAIVDAVAMRSSKLVVHSSTARERLIERYDLDPTQIDVIVHGARSRVTPRRSVGGWRPTVITWGLIGPGKGIEHGIAAVADLRASGIEVEYIVSGVTHPNVLRDHGDDYRHGLLALSRSLGVADLVRFDPHYRSQEEQSDLLALADLVLLPYDTRDQVTSGVLVEALAAGLPVVATAFPHAQELADSGAVLVVDHGDPGAIADAVRLLVTDERRHRAVRRASWFEGMRHDWSIVGERYRSVLESVEAAEWEAVVA